MYGRRHSWLILTLFLAVLAGNSSVSAQSWLSDRKRAEGHGIRLGDFELHPGIGAEGGYISNPFYSEPGSKIHGTAALRVAPHIYLSTLKGERREGDVEAKPGMLSLSGGLSGSYQHYFNVGAQNYLNLDFDIDAVIAPERPVAFRIANKFRLSTLPFGDTTVNPVSGEPINTDYTNFYELAEAQLMFQSAGGLLRGSLGYRFGFTWFSAAGFAVNNNMRHSATLNLGWEFLPKTALFYDATYAFQDYPNLDASINADGTVNAAGRVTWVANNHQVSTRIGINGAITSRIGATVAVGYAAGFFPVGEDGDGIIGTVEARYTPSEMAEIALTADRAILPAYQGNFQERTRIHARTRWLFLGSLLIAARGGVEFLNFGTDVIQDVNGKDARFDMRYFAELSGEYRFVDWLAVTTQLGLLVDDTDYEFDIPTGEGNNTFKDPAKYTAVEAWLGVRVFL